MVDEHNRALRRAGLGVAQRRAQPRQAAWADGPRPPLIRREAPIERVAAVLRAGRAYEQATEWYQRKPAL